MHLSASRAPHCLAGRPGTSASSLSSAEAMGIEPHRSSRAIGFRDRLRTTPPDASVRPTGRSRTSAACLSDTPVDTATTAGKSEVRGSTGTARSPRSGRSAVTATERSEVNHVTRVRFLRPQHVSPVPRAGGSLSRTQALGGATPPAGSRSPSTKGSSRWTLNPEIPVHFASLRGRHCTPSTDVDSVQFRSSRGGTQRAPFASGEAAGLSSPRGGLDPRTVHRAES